MRLVSKSCAAVLIAAMLAEPAAALPFQPVEPAQPGALVLVQHHPHAAGAHPGGGHSGGGVYRGSRGGGYHGHGGGGGGDGGAVAAGAIFGLVLGAMIASQAQRQNAVAWCSRRFRSYDPYSMTYVGRDGRRHRCP